MVQSSSDASQLGSCFILRNACGVKQFSALGEDLPLPQVFVASYFSSITADIC